MRNLAYALLFLPALATWSDDAVGAPFLFETASLGETGITWEALNAQEVPGVNVNRSVFVGSRFYIARPTLVDSVGGHFASAGPRSIFGALISLTGKNDFPDSAELDTPDVVATTLLQLTGPSGMATGPVRTQLEQGWYGIVFGGGILGASGAGSAVKNGNTLGGADYITWQPGAGGTGWSNRPTTLDGVRLVVSGTAVPEPSSAASAVSLAIALAASVGCGRRRAAP